MTKKVTFTDSFKITQPSEEQKVEWSDSLMDSKKSLYIQMDATHAAIGNGNNRFYLPSMMKKGAPSFMGKRGKTAPLLLQHGGGMLGSAKDQSPVGRVRDVSYINTVPSEMSDSNDVDLLLDDTIPIRKQVRAARKFLQNDVVKNDDWEGLGFIRLGAEVLDPETIDMVQDGRFDSVSVSFRSNHAFCSICAADWASDDDGPCEHEPGKVYEDEDTEIKERMLLIPGDMEFKECSFVTFGADQHSSISIADPRMSDSENDSTKTFSDNAVLPISSMVWEMKDSKKGANMKKISTTDGGSIELSDSEEEIFEAIKKLHPEAQEDSLAEKAKLIQATKNEDGLYPNQAKDKLDEDTCILNALEDLEDKDSEMTAVEIYGEISKELEGMVKDGLMTEEKLKEVKLSDEQVENLSDSSFCGKDKTFPVPDCEHITAVKRFLDRYEGTLNKDDILAAVAVKENALGYEVPEAPASDSQDEDEESVVIPVTLDNMSDEVLKSSFDDTESEMVKRGLTVKRECSECASQVKIASDAKEEATQATSDLTDSQERVNILRDELRHEFSNYKELVDQMVSIKRDLMKSKSDYAAVTAVLSKKSDSLEDAQKVLTDAKDFDKEFINFTDKVDLSEIFAKMDNGMVNDNPDGTVDNPVNNDAQDNDQGDSGLSKTEQAIIERIKESIEDGEFLQAKSLYDRMITKGILRDSVKWETLLPVKNADK